MNTSAAMSIMKHKIKKIINDTRQSNHVLSLEQERLDRQNQLPSIYEV
nr:11700_t:CDS:2 [Entrophospora candida]